MAKYIDADKLRKLLANRYEEITVPILTDEGGLESFYRRSEIHNILKIVDSLQQEESVSEDLEKEIRSAWEKCNPVDEGMGVESTYMHIEAFDIIARHFAEWGSEHLKK